MPEAHGRSHLTLSGYVSHEDVNGIMQAIEKVWPGCVVQSADKPFLPMWITNRSEGAIVIFRDEGSFCSWQLSENVEDSPVYASWGPAGMVVEGPEESPVLKALHERQRLIREEYLALVSAKAAVQQKSKGFFSFLRRGSS